MALEPQAVPGTSYTGHGVLTNRGRPEGVRSLSLASKREAKLNTEACSGTCRGTAQEAPRAALTPREKLTHPGGTQKTQKKKNTTQPRGPGDFPRLIPSLGPPSLPHVNILQCSMTFA